MPFMSMFIVLRTFRLFRLIRYGNRLPYTQKIISSLLTLMPLFTAFFMIFAIFFYVFAIIGVNLYGDTFVSFSSLGSAMFTLLQVLTLDAWASSIARAVMVVYPGAWIYFSAIILISFMLLASFMATAIVQIINKKEHN